jgi:hypothetical protein
VPASPGALAACTWWSCLPARLAAVSAHACRILGTCENQPRKMLQIQVPCSNICMSEAKATCTSVPGQAFWLKQCCYHHQQTHTCAGYQLYQWLCVSDRYKLPMHAAKSNEKFDQLVYATKNRTVSKSSLKAYALAATPLSGCWNILCWSKRLPDFTD